MPLLLLLTIALPTAGSSPAAVALLPSVGPASDDDRRGLDEALRAALLDADEIDLLSPVETRQQLMSLAEMGLVCLPEDVPCLVKLGLVSNVGWVLVPVVERPAGREIKIEIGVVDVAAAKRARTIEGTVSLDDQKAIGALALRAMGIGGTDTVPDHPLVGGEGEGEGEGEVSEGEGEVSEGEGEKPDAPPSPGVIVAGIGGAVAGVSLVGALVCEAVFGKVIQANAETRRNIQPLGAVLWGTTILGAAAVGAGIYLLTEEPAQ